MVQVVRLAVNSSSSVLIFFPFGFFFVVCFDSARAVLSVCFHSLFSISCFTRIRISFKSNWKNKRDNLHILSASFLFFFSTPGPVIVWMCLLCAHTWCVHSMFGHAIALVEFQVIVLRKAKNWSGYRKIIFMVTQTTELLANTQWPL